MTEQTTVAFDVGNTRIKCATINGDNISLKFTIPTRPLDTLLSRLRQAQQNEANRIPDGAKAAVSSVCPPANDALRTFWNAMTTASIFFLDNRVPLPISNEITKPGRIGTDRLLCALAGRQLRGEPCIIIMAGTAITVDLVNANGEFAGGTIAPGYALCARALGENTATLPRITPSGNVNGIGHDTVTAIQSGIHHFCRGGVNSVLNDLSRVSGQPPTVILTGGDATKLLSLDTSLELVHRPALIFEGISATLNAHNI
jgi:type III pantothenate kinase